MRLGGLVSAQIHKVRVTKGAERWSIEKSGLGEKTRGWGKWSLEDVIASNKVIGGRLRQRGFDRRRGVRKRGRSSFSICLGLRRLVYLTQKSGI